MTAVYSKVNTPEEQAQIDAMEARPEVDIAADVAETSAECVHGYGPGDAHVCGASR